MSNGTPRLQASSPSPSPSQHKDGSLEAVVLSVHDLPSADQPNAVTLSACGITVRSGPPVARHKGGNSFRFSSSPTSATQSPTSSENSPSPSKEKIVLAAPLRDLYAGTLAVRVTFEDAAKTLLAEYKLNELHVEQSSWLILSLKPEEAGRNSLADPAIGELHPTIRLKLQLHGPYRQEIAALVALWRMWFDFVDLTESRVRNSIKHLPLPNALPRLPLPKIMLVPFVPVLTIIAAVIPILVGVLIVGMPMFAPLVAVLIVSLFSVAAIGCFFIASSQHGRDIIYPRLAPIMDSLLSSPAGQAMVYDTGPRPSPVSFARQMLPSSLWGKLIASLLIDLLGSSSYLIPVAGELVDIAWAPIQTTLIMAMYDEVSPNLKYVSFVEEILFFTDIVPTATMGWAQEFGPELLSMVLGDDGIGRLPKAVKQLVPAAST